MARRHSKILFCHSGTQPSTSKRILVMHRIATGAYEARQVIPGGDLGFDG